MAMHKKPSYAELERKLEELDAELAQYRRQSGMETVKTDNWLRGVFEYSPLAVALTDFETGELLEVNDVFCREFRASREEFLGHSVTELRLYSPEERKAFKDQLAANGTVYGWETSFYLMDGARKHVKMFARLFPDKKGKQVLSMFHDITERKRMEEDLLREKNRAETANRAKSEFLANMSHEIRTPLNGISGMIQLMQMCELNDELREYVDNAHLASKNLNTILSDILDLAKIEAGKLNISETSFDIRDVLNEVYGAFIYQFNQKGLLLILEVDPRIPRNILGDPARIRQILFNLVGNSVKFTAQGSVTVSVFPLQMPGPEGRPRLSYLKCPRDGLRLLFRVADTGDGLSDDDVGKMFDPFVQVGPDESGHKTGTGLGLRIVREFVSLMGGGLCVSSASGEGTEIYFTLELGLEAADAPSPTGAAVPGREASSDIASRRILVVDDDPMSRIAVSRMLRKNAQQVGEAESGIEALRLLEREDYDLVLMDVRMPGMDGMETAGRIREIFGQREEEPPTIVAMTAYAMKGDREKFLTGGMDGYLAKPLVWDDLLDVLNPADKQGE